MIINIQLTRDQNESRKLCCFSFPFDLTGGELLPPSCSMTLESTSTGSVPSLYAGESALGSSSS